MERNVARKGMVLEVPEHLLELVDWVNGAWWVGFNIVVFFSVALRSQSNVVLRSAFIRSCLFWSYGAKESIITCSADNGSPFDTPGRERGCIWLGHHPFALLMALSRACRRSEFRELAWLLQVTASA
jgi:hypothetical protein